MPNRLVPFALLSAASLLLTSCGLRESAPSGPLTYDVAYTDSAIRVDGRLDEAAWKLVSTVEDFQFPWWTAGKKEKTKAKLLWDEQYLYVSFVCEDAHIWAEHTERDSPVYKDDCVEVFTSPNPDQLENYFNIEMNVKGASLDFQHPEGPGSKVPWDPKLGIATTIDGTLNDDTDTDTLWTLEAAIPFRAFSHVAKNTPPQPGHVWRLNLHRLGGQTNTQHSQWNPSVSEKPLFHAPQFFGSVTFVKQTPEDAAP